jgi:hypothetical protein
MFDQVLRRVDPDGRFARGLKNSLLTWQSPGKIKRIQETVL